MESPVDTLPAEIELALAYTPVSLRDRLRTAFALDQRLGRIAAATTEPILGQMRLAWWRDMLGEAGADRPRGDAVLDAIGDYWTADQGSLVEMVDGWEEFIVAERIGPDVVKRLANGRAAPIAAVLATDTNDSEDRICVAATRYFTAEAASRLSEPEEKQAAIDTGLALSADLPRLPREARGLAVLEALALRSLRGGGEPIMAGRGASFTALRAGILGR